MTAAVLLNLYIRTIEREMFVIEVEISNFKSFHKSVVDSEPYLPYSF